MKKAAAILLMLIFLFNLGGYQIVVRQLDIKAGRSLEALLDKNVYYISGLTEIRLLAENPAQHQPAGYDSYHDNIYTNTHIISNQNEETPIVVYKDIVNNGEPQSKDFRYDMNSAKSTAGASRNSHPKQHSSFTLNILGEYDNQPVFLSHNQADYTITHISCYSFTIPAFHGQTPHQPPDC